MSEEVKITTTEAKILESAKKVFYLRGLKGARMEEIAKEANINTALLHYYFRTKEKLYLKIFDDAISNFKVQILELANQDMQFEEKVKHFVEKYISLLLENSYLPIFIINELNQNPDRIIEILNVGDELRETLLLRQFNEEILKGNIRPVNFFHFLLNLLSLCVFPFISKPIFKSLFNLSEEQFTSLILERKNIIPDIILKWLKN